MGDIIAVIAGIMMVGVWLIVVYNLGFLLAARSLDYRVTEFGVGYPPEVLSFPLGATRYVLAALPLGGYVRVQPETTGPKGAIIAGAGPVAVILAAVALTALQGMLGLDRPSGQGAIIREAVSTEGLGLRAGGVPIHDGADLVSRLRVWRSGEILVEVIRDGAPVNVSLVRREGAEDEDLGVVFASATERYEGSLVEAVGGAVPTLMKHTAGQIVAVLARLRGMDFESGSGSAGGLLIVSTFALSLGVLNLLPLPQLIGDRLVRIAVASVVSPWHEERVDRVTSIVSISFVLVLVATLVMIMLREGFGADALTRAIQWSEINVRWKA